MPYFENQRGVLHTKFKLFQAIHITFDLGIQPRNTYILAKEIHFHTCVKKIVIIHLSVIATNTCIILHTHLFFGYDFCIVDSNDLKFIVKGTYDYYARKMVLGIFAKWFIVKK